MLRAPSVLNYCHKGTFTSLLICTYALIQVEGGCLIRHFLVRLTVTASSRLLKWPEFQVTTWRKRKFSHQIKKTSQSFYCRKCHFTLPASNGAKRELPLYVSVCIGSRNRARAINLFKIQVYSGRALCSLNLTRNGNGSSSRTELLKKRVVYLSIRVETATAGE